MHRSRGDCLIGDFNGELQNDAGSVLVTLTTGARMQIGGSGRVR
jgi:hypothetical protein